MFHLQRTVPDWTRALPLLPDGALVKATENYQIFREVKAANPRLITCARMVRDNAQVYDALWLDTTEARNIARAWFNSFVDGTFRDQIAPFCDVVQFHNEVWANSQNAEERRWRDAANEAAAHVWNTEFRPRLPGDIRLCLSTAAVGNWLSKRTLQIAVQTDNLAGYHPYDLWQRKQRWADSWAALSGLWDRMEHISGMKPNWIFPEAGPFESAVTGWRASECLGGDPALYVEAVRRWILDVQKTAAYKEGRLWGFALFTTGSPSPQWNSYETRQPEMDSLARMLSQEWRPGTAPPTPPPPPPPSNELHKFLWGESVAEQIATGLRLNPDAAIQREIYKAGMMPVHNEYICDYEGQRYTIQAAESLDGSKARRVYIWTPDEGVRWITKPV